MARQIVETFTDDLDGSSEDVVTVYYTWNGSDFEIDLSAANRDRFTKALAPFLDASRRQAVQLTGRSSSFSKQKAKSAGVGSSDAALARAWGRSTGHPDVTERGRVKPTLLQAWQSAGSPIVNDISSTSRVADFGSTTSKGKSSH